MTPIGSWNFKQLKGKKWTIIMQSSRQESPLPSEKKCLPVRGDPSLCHPTRHHRTPQTPLDCRYQDVGDIGSRRVDRGNGLIYLRLHRLAFCINVDHQEPNNWFANTKAIKYRWGEVFWVASHFGTDNEVDTAQVVVFLWNLQIWASWAMSGIRKLTCIMHLSTEFFSSFTYCEILVEPN